VKKTRVLVVEDDTSVRRVLARVFERAGFSVATAPNGEDALPFLAKERFEVMVCDISMPKMTGRQLCQHLAANGPYLPHCTFIVTSRSEAEERSWISRYDEIVMVEKPVGPRHLLRLVRQRLSEEEAVGDGAGRG